MTERQKRIMKMWDKVTDENDDDASTEFLISLTADRAKVSYSDVVDALQAAHKAGR